MIRLIRRLYVRAWNIGFTWLNVRSQIIGAVTLFAVVYPFALFVQTKALFIAFLLGVMIRDVVRLWRRLGEIDPLYLTQEFYQSMIADIFAVGVSYVVAQQVEVMQLSAKTTIVSMVIPLLVLAFVWDLNQYHFSPDGAFGLYRSHHYIFTEDDVSYLGIHPDPDSLIEEWAVERYERFMDKHLDAMAEKNADRQKRRFGL